MQLLLPSLQPAAAAGSHPGSAAAQAPKQRPPAQPFSSSTPDAVCPITAAAAAAAGGGDVGAQVPADFGPGCSSGSVLWGDCVLVDPGGCLEVDTVVGCKSKQTFKAEQAEQAEQADGQE
jgi:hypothetical protein